jgi:hypothetical protein
VATLLNKPYDAFADEGAEEEEVEEVKKPKQGQYEPLLQPERSLEVL